MSAIKVPVPVLWDKDFNFLNNALVSADILSVIVGTVKQPNKVYPPQAIPVLVNTLQINEPTFGTLYSSWSLTQWQAAIISVSGTSAGSTSKSLTYTIGADKPSGATITDPALVNVTLLEIWIDGISQDVRAIGYASAAGILTFSPALVNGQVVSILCYNN